ncbi:MAG TPA: ABC transporter permease [Symbiobacteriaceae bacterium]
MKKVWLIAVGGLTRMARDPRALLMLLAMPMILIGILGVALKPMMDTPEFKPFDVILVNADAPAKPVAPPGTPAAVLEQLPTFEFGKLLQDEVLLSDQAKKIMNLKTATDLAAAKDQVINRKAVAVIYVAPTFSADVMAGKASTIQLFSDAGNPSQADIVAQVVGYFTEAVTADALAVMHPAPGQSGPAALNQNARDAALKGLPKVVETTAGARTKDVGAMQYYAAAMALMFMLMTAIARAATIIEERQNGTLGRMLMSPTAKGIILAGQLLGSVIIVVVQFVILMLGTRFLYGVDWGPTAEALLLAGAYSLAVSGIGTATAGWLNDAKAAGAAVGVVGNIFAALSGAMFPISLFPPFLRLIARFIPNYWALQGFLDQMSGIGGLAHLVTPVAILAAIGVVFGALGTWRLAAR